MVKSLLDMFSVAPTVAAPLDPNDSLIGDCTVRTIHVTPELAREILATMEYGRQRRIRTDHVMLLARELARGTFKPCTIEINTLGDRKYLIDGYHRLHAIIEAGIGSELIMIERRVDSMDQVDSNYAIIDTGLVRTGVDRAKAHDLAGRFGLNQRITTSLGGAVAVIAGDFDFDPNDPRVRDVVRSDNVRISTMEHWLPEMHRFTRLLDTLKDPNSQRNRRKFRAAGALAIILVTLRYRTETAEKFWSAVIENDGLRREQPERVLADFLETTPVNQVGQRLFVRSIARCWNAFMEGKTLTFAVMRKNDHMLNGPIVIKGTPYDGASAAKHSAA